MTIERILVPTDFSEAATNAVEYATELAGRFGARLLLFHAVDLSEVVGDHDSSASTVRLEAEADKSRARGIEVDVHVVEGTPVAAIRKSAQELEADLIVMGTHGRRGLDRLILGSVAAVVMRNAPAPVITVPPQYKSTRGQTHA